MPPWAGHYLQVVSMQEPKRVTEETVMMSCWEKCFVAVRLGETSNNEFVGTTFLVVDGQEWFSVWLWWLHTLVTVEMVP